MDNLTEIIRSEIEIQGPISFELYMEQALYHPTLGYYRKVRDPFGRSGDFFTAAQLQPVFGETIRTFVAHCAEMLACPEPMQILDLGAGRAELGPIIADSYAYRAVEIGDTLPNQVQSGVIIANEFFDALPVRLAHRLLTGEWREMLVRWSMDRFEFIPSEQDLLPELRPYVDLFGHAIPAGGLLEVNLAMRNWVQQLAQVILRGTLLVIDYGYEASEIMRFSNGSLMSYHRHLASSEVLATPGMRDITSHVNFSWLKYLAASCGFQVKRECRLSDFAADLWKEPALQRRLGTSDAGFKAQWKQLVFGMGETFQVVILEKRRG